MAKLAMGLPVVLWAVVVFGDLGQQVSSGQTILQRIRRGYGNSGYNGGSGYGHGSDERDASVSAENGYNGCSGEDAKGYSSSGSRELAYSRDGRANNVYPRGHALTKSSASASAGAFSSSQTHKSNIV